MATLADSLISTTSRPVTLRMRPDLQARKHTYQGRTYWVVKEPIGLNYFRFHEEEYAILCMLDGKTSLDNVKDQFEREFAPQKITYQDLQQFIGMLHRSGLVLSDAVGQGKQLRRRRDEKKRREFLGKLANIFAMRFRGIDPERMFVRIFPYTGWFFSPMMRLIVLLLAAAAGSLVLVQFDVFQSRLPAFHEFFAAKNWFWMLIVMGVVKVLHEFGHGLSCTYYGGECHELGVMMLVFTPCLYCNVSDSWMLPNKWNRAFIGFAGMYVEIFLASCATFIWWFSEPGLLNHIALSVMFICSVSTVIFNGNPLLRFDGYYILMDLLEIPNLRQKSTELLKRFLVQLCLGIEQPENPFLPRENRFLFGAYTAAAVVYRWIVVFSILWFLNQVLEPYGLKILGQMIALSGFVGLVVQPTYALWKFFYTPGRMHKMKRHRLIATVAVCVAALVAFIWLPLPFHVPCTLEVRAKDAETVYAAVPGQLKELAGKVGKTVKRGDLIARLENIDLAITLASLEGQLSEAESRLASQRREGFGDARLTAQLPQLEKTVESLKEEIREKTIERDRLAIVAPIDGTILPADPKPKPPAADERLPTWTGSPFERRNRDVWFERSDPICLVGHPHQLKAVLVIEQADMNLVKIGDEVEVMLESHPGKVYRSKVEEIASAELKMTPSKLAPQAGGGVDSKTDPTTGVTKPLQTSYQVRATLTECDDIHCLGLRGKAKVYTGWQPLWTRLYRYLARTFHFEL